MNDKDYAKRLQSVCDTINKNQAQRRRVARWDSIKEWLGIGLAGTGIGAIVLLGCLAIIVLLVIAPLVLATLIYFGWNLAIVPIFGMPAITFLWQSIGLAFLVMVASTIFKGLVKVTHKD